MQNDFVENRIILVNIPEFEMHKGLISENEAKQRLRH